MVKKTIIPLIIFCVFWQMLLPLDGTKIAAADTPDVTIEVTDPGSVEEGDIFDFTISLTNNSSDSLEDATVEIDSSSFIPTDGDLEKDIHWNSNKTDSVTYNLTYDGGSDKTIEINVYDSAGNDVEVGGDTLYRISTYSTSDDDDDDSTDTSEYVPVINIVDNAVSSVLAGTKTSVTLTVENTSSYTAEKIRITPDLSGNGVFTIDSENVVQTITRLRPDQATTVKYSFLISPYAEEKVQELKFNFEFTNAYDDSFDSFSDSIYVKVMNSNTAPRLEIADMDFQNSVEGQPNAVIANLKIANSGNLPAKDIQVSLTGLKDDGLGLYKDTNFKSLAEMDSNGEAVVSYTLLPARKIEKGNYGLTAKIEYKDESGKDYSFEYQFFVPVEHGASGGTVPKIILNQYSCNPTIVQAGENFSLDLSFLNTSKDKSVRNIKIFLTVPESEDEDSSGSVFSPVKSSNTFYIDEILPKEVYHKTLDFFTIPNADPKTYTLTANFEYEDESGTEYKATELIGVPVSQLLRIETSEIQLPAESFVGEPIPISLDFYNTGKAKVSNMMIKLEGEGEGGFDIQNGSYYVGNFDVGASDYYEGTMTPNALGLLKGAVIISYDEANGESVEVRKEFTLNVSEMPMPELPPEMNPEGMEPKAGPLKIALMVGLPVLTVALIAIILIKKGVIRRLINKKKGVTLDE